MADFAAKGFVLRASDRLELFTELLGVHTFREILQNRNELRLILGLPKNVLNSSGVVFVTNCNLSKQGAGFICCKVIEAESTSIVRILQLFGQTYHFNQGGLS